MSASIISKTLSREYIADIELFRCPESRGGCPMFLLHGIGSNAHSFERMIEELTPEIDAIAWNAPGYGASKSLAELSPAPHDYIVVLASLLDQLGISRTVLVGHSLGALFAARFAAVYPDRVSALALLSPALGYRVPAGEALPPAVQQRIDELQALGPAAFSKKRASRLVADPQRMPHVLAAVERAMAAVDPHGYAQAVRALGAGDMIADLAAVSAPLLVAVGSKDVIAPAANAEAARDAARQYARYYEIEGAGHALPQEEPALIANLLTAFVRENADV